ncbi:MAG TPA: efflux RND transporter periplasmic adaptor subunit [Thermoanaerobaculia bacterium]|nr:efflux RND transporter periplasmic adaptor subunit [Thermoanaerobaculia bacterium]
MTSNRLSEFAALSVATAIALFATACQQADRTEPPARISGVAVDVARAASVPDVFEVTGTLHARTTSQLAANVVGTVTRVLVAEGDRVRAGQLLIAIDSRAAKAQVQMARGGAEELEGAIASATAAERAAQAQATLASATYKRYAALRERGSVSPHELDQIEAQAKAASADLDRATAAKDALISRRAEVNAGVVAAEAQAGYSALRAPIDGIVATKSVDAGSQAAPGMVLMTIEGTGAMRIDAYVDDVQATRIHAGDDAEADVAPAGVVHARVAQVVPALDAATRTSLVKLDLMPGPSQSSQLRPGQFARVRLAGGTRNALTVPDTAIVARGQLRNVYVVAADGIARMRLVTLGRAFGGRTEILAGLDPGERFVTAVTPAVRDGVIVAAVRAPRSAGVPAAAAERPRSAVCARPELIPVARVTRDPKPFERPSRLLASGNDPRPTAKRGRSAVAAGTAALHGSAGTAALHEARRCQA